MYPYTLTEWILFFFAYSFCGWVFESIEVSIRQKHLVNRGFLHGPVLPLYGTGAILMLHVALPLKAHPIALYFAGLIAATALEYVVGWGMESIFKVKYWDYSYRKWQYKGRICLVSSLAWGVLTLVLVYGIHPAIKDAVLRLNPSWQVLLSHTLCLLFATDLGMTLRSALDLAKVLAEVSVLSHKVAQAKHELASLSEQVAKEALTTKLTQLEGIYQARKQAVQDVVQKLRKRNPTAISKYFETLHK